MVDCGINKRVSPHNQSPVCNYIPISVQMRVLQVPSNNRRKVYFGGP